MIIIMITIIITILILIKIYFKSAFQDTQGRCTKDTNITIKYK